MWSDEAHMSNCTNNHAGKQSQPAADSLMLPCRGFNIIVTERFIFAFTMFITKTVEFTTIIIIVGGYLSKNVDSICVKSIATSTSHKCVVHMLRRQSLGAIG